MGEPRYLADKPWSHGVGHNVSDKNWNHTFGDGMSIQNCEKCGYLFKTSLIIEPFLCDDCARKAIELDPCGEGCSHPDHKGTR